MSSPRRVALTGGIATGKSHCLKTFGALGVPTIDADHLARDVVRRGSKPLAAIVRRFGSDVIGGSGDLDRDALAKIVFDDAEARKDLEAIIHPEVYAAITKWFGQLAAPFGIADVPLLYETQHDSDFDLVIVAACPWDLQLSRLRLRGYTDEQARQRFESQLPIEEKVRRADFVIETSGTLEDTDRQVVEVWERLRTIAMRQ